MKLLGDWNWYLPKWLEWLPSSTEAPSRIRSRLGAACARADRVVGDRPSGQTPRRRGQPGWMFWLRQKKLDSSYTRLSRASRS